MPRFFRVSLHGRERSENEGGRGGGRVCDPLTGQQPTFTRADEMDEGGWTCNVYRGIKMIEPNTGTAYRQFDVCLQA